CLSFGFDLSRSPIPVVPAAHYMCGGVMTDLTARTSIAQLYAAGETAMTGLHGANRLASNSLLEAAVMGRRAATAAREDIAEAGERRAPEFPGWDPGRAIRSEERVLITQSWDEVRRLMWNYVGIVRSDARLERAMRRIELVKQEVQGYYWEHLIDSDLVELRNLVKIAELVVRAAALRKESRGLHYTIDYPDRDDANWLHDTVIAKGA
ncbi:MAG TPA: FAD-binding protein, partial [Candidatus Binataceae bacterium]